MEPFQQNQSTLCFDNLPGRSFRPVVSSNGQVLYQRESYAETVIQIHQLSGWITAVLSLLCALCYWYKSRLAQWLPFTALSITCISLTIAGHYGASITHGADYLSQAFQEKELEDGILSEKLQEWLISDTLSNTQLDELNLKVRAIFAHNCYQCHSTAKRKGGLALDHEEGVFAGGDAGRILIKGNAGNSEIIRRLKLPRQEEEAMPPKGKTLKAEEIELIAFWINQGAHWADEGLKVFREAPIALSRPKLPETPPEISHPIDKFVHNYFIEQGIKWPKPISDQRFIRRAHLDVTGLLPSPQEVDEFVQDKTPDKRAKLIQTLLADKQHYALHWLSFWNDLLRNDYSGPGFITKGRKQITDWLYHSLLEEKPYKQMVEELINPGPESEGFIQGIQWRGVVNASQRTELQAAQNISQSLLGLNLKCASCHNSFINNLTLDQAYGFANIFADSTLEIHRCDKPTGRYAKTAFLYPELGEVVSDSLQKRLKQLADVISQPENGRLYRTIVNRFWDKLFGRGIVAPVDEMDKLPWNPDLLDWLASDFIANGYNLSQLLELIMTSKAYQLPSVNYPSENYLNAEQFVFRGPCPKRMSAEQFVDAVSQFIHPLYHGVAYFPGESAQKANWIWYRDMAVDREILPKPGTRYFRKTFELERRAEIKSADILITADHSFELFLNGQKLGQGNNWRAVQKIALASNQLEKENCIAIIGTNEGSLPNPAGILFTLRMIYSDDQEEYLYSDKSWMTYDTLPPHNWLAYNFEETDWKAARSRGKKSYWGHLLQYSFETDSIPLSFARAALVQQDPFLKALGRPTRENVSTKRPETTTLLQALMLTNNALLTENIQNGAETWLQKTNGNPEDLMTKLYWNALGRLPTKKEAKTIRKLLGKRADAASTQDLIWSILLLPEFQFY